MEVTEAPANVFGVIVAGRLLQADFVQAGETEFVTEVSDASSINHVVVFLTGVTPFPDGTGGSVYIRWPQGNGGDMNWHYLGFISNEKPSAIFRVSQLRKLDALHEGVFTNLGLPTGATAHGSAQIGIEVESMAAIGAKVPAVGTAPSQQAAFIEFAQKMLQNFVNHAESFVVQLPRPDNPVERGDFIPASVVQYWFTNFRRRFDQNPEFWRNLS
uniref:Hikeshi-like domain-containing protein n=1 Tax=Parascaris univalens TaxID=6257 RepID=A0A914ZUH6_PARUN